ncbi:RNA polymerase sigma factor SigZ [Paenibacillus pasadenensis]|uniref:RNA polymerase sigma factor n=1 Tax=Paenibacillus pasadenensis TaxID=217090 RepID=A0A2N5NCI7_9BACL|nr:RNA polymerase sigma factor SigZ [Paenibacillus pasadenensis]PLT48059.1 RNA polymerase sigma factor SigZ [Paenibacillus pasadenensis]
MKVEQLWEEYHEAVRKFVLHKTNRHPDADDIVQMTFMKAYEGLARLQDEEKRRAWIYQIARNSIVDHFRKTKRADALPEQVAMAEEEPAAACNSEAAEGMMSILARLPDKYREALELSELQGMSQKQLSEQLHLSYSGAKSRVQRGRELVREMMTSCRAIEADPYGNIIEYAVIHEEPKPKRKPRP